ncbi:MAG: hypothetical protein K0R34_885 [Herbinix sp.]|nr:hypothetical protein [Herbinix sp.]
MKRIIKLITVLILIALVLSGCGTKEEIPNPNDPATSDQTPQGNGEEVYSFRAQIIEGGVTLLITPSEESNEARSSDKISVSYGEATLVDGSGATITSEDLQTGDILVISYNGIILESYPAQITASKIEKVDHNNLIDGYLSLIDDIYQEDDGLNSEITTIALDTSGWINLTVIEKEMIFAKVKEVYGLEVVEGTYEELAEQKIIDKDKLFFPDGVLIKISEITYDENKEVITCAISKWRSGDGAIGADDVTATLKDGVWEISKEGNWIS